MLADNSHEKPSLIFSEKLKYMLCLSGASKVSICSYDGKPVTSYFMYLSSSNVSGADPGVFNREVKIRKGVDSVKWSHLVYSTCSGRQAIANSISLG